MAGETEKKDKVKTKKGGAEGVVKKKKKKENAPPGDAGDASVDQLLSPTTPGPEVPETPVDHFTQAVDEANGFHGTNDQDQPMSSENLHPPDAVNLDETPTAPGAVDGASGLHEVNDRQDQPMPSGSFHHPEVVDLGEAPITPEAIDAANGSHEPYDRHDSPTPYDSQHPAEIFDHEPPTESEQIPPDEQAPAYSAPLPNGTSTIPPSVMTRTGGSGSPPSTGPKTKTSFTSHRSGSSALPELLGGIRETIANLTQAFQALEQQAAAKTPESARGQSTLPDLGAIPDYKAQVHQLRRHLVAQDRSQEEQVAKVNELIENILKGQIAEQLRRHLKDMVKVQLGSVIKEHVAHQIAASVSPDLARKMTEHRHRMAVVSQSLRNAEARRANAQIRATNLSEALTPLVRLDGTPSEHFPVDIPSLIILPPRTIHGLMDEYNIPHGKGMKDSTADLSKLMHCIGVSFTMVLLPHPTLVPLHGGA